MKRLKSHLRNGAEEAVSLPVWPSELAGAVGLLHYGRLFDSPVKAGDFASLLSTLMPYSVWCRLAFVVGALSFLMASASLWVQWEPCRLRQFVAFASGVLWVLLIYSCWRNDAPFVLWEVFAIWLGFPLATLILLHVQENREDDEENEEAHSEAQSIGVKYG